MIIHKTTSLPLFSGTVTDYLRSKKSHNSDKAAFIDSETGNAISFRQVWEMSARLSAILYHKHKLDNPSPHPKDPNLGPVVLLHANNFPYLASVHYALLDLGATIAPAAASYDQEDLSHQIRVAQPQLIVCNKAFRQKVYLANTASKMGTAKVVFIEDLLTETAFDHPTFPKFSSHDPARVAYLGMSSGTSGLAKAVRQTHLNLSSSSEGVLASQPLLQADNNVTAAIVPMTHVYGLTKFVFHSVASGMTTVVFQKFSLEALLAAQVRFSINVLYLVPPVIVALAKDPAVKPYLQSLNELTDVIGTGAAPLPPTAGEALLERITGNKDGERKGRAPLALVQGYGLTETAQISVFSPSDPERDIKCAGKLLPNCEIRVVNDQGKDMPRSEWSFVHPPTGEIWVRGPSVMAGYHQNDAANSETFVASSDSSYPWLKTGDIGYIDLLGRLTIVDRCKEMMKVSGRQVAPAEIESILLGHPQVEDVAVVGVSTDRGTESARAFIVAEARALPVIKQWFDRRVPSYKRLYGGIVRVDKIPKSSSGKILRRELRLRQGDDIFGEYVEAKL